MAPLKDEHGIDGAEDYPGDEGDYGEEGGAVEDQAGEDTGEEPSEEEAGEGQDAQPGETEVHEVTAERPRSHRHRRRRHARRRRLEEARARRRTNTIIAVAVVLILVAGAWYFWGPSGSISKITLITRSYKDSHNVSGMALLAIIDAGKPSSLSGSGDLRISRDGAGVYSGQVDVSESKAKKDLPLGSFATGNGDYSVQFVFQGFTATTTFTTSEIIEKLNVTSFDITTKNNATLVQPGRARVGFTATFLSSDDVTQLATDKDVFEVEIIKDGVADKHTENVVSTTQVNANYPVPGNGNYAVRATFHNSKVKPGSKYSIIEATGSDSETLQPFTTVTIPPFANAGPNQTVSWKLSDNGAVVQFDGTASVAYEGATIVTYYWDYGDFTGEDGARTAHTYTKVPDATQPLYYYVTLIVTDSNGQYSTGTATIKVTV